MNKVCRKCGVEKPLEDYYKDAQKADGHKNQCKECSKKREKEYKTANNEHIKHYLKEWKQINADHVSQYNKEHRQMEICKTSNRLSKERQRVKYPEKWRARNTVKNAVKRGKIKRPGVCSRCNSTGQIEAHHPDYSRPLDIKWLCSDCHRLEHKEGISQCN